MKKIDNRLLFTSVVLSLSMFVPLLGCESKEASKSIGIKGKKLYDGTFCITEYIDEKHIKYEFAYSNEEAKKYLEVKNPTFEDVREALQKNNKLSNEFKKAVFDYIASLEQKHPNIDLSIFYYNITKLDMSFDDRTLSKSSKKAADIMRVAALFDVKTHMICLSEDFDYENEDDIFTLWHELTHTKASAVIVQKDQTILRVNYFYVYEDNSLRYIGQALNEGATELSVLDVMNLEAVPYSKMDDAGNASVSAYYEYSDIFSLLSFCANDDEFSYHEDGMLNLIDNLKENGISNPVELIKSADDDYMISGKYGTSRKEIYEEVFSDKCNHWLDNGYDAKRIGQRIDDTIDQCFIEKMLDANDPIISTLYGAKQQSIKEAVRDAASKIVGEQLGESAGSSVVTQAGLFIYQDKDGNIKSCYKMVVNGTNLYSDGEQYIDEEDIVCGDYLSVLLEKEVVEKGGENNSVMIDVKKWNEYFFPSKQKRFTKP